MQKYYAKDANFKLIPIYAHCKVVANQPIRIELWDEDGHYVKASGERNTEKAVNRALSNELVKQQMGKLGNTPFELKDISLDIQPGLSLPLSEINSTRRKAIYLLEQERAMGYRKERGNQNDNSTRN